MFRLLLLYILPSRPAYDNTIKNAINVFWYFYSLKFAKDISRNM